ncbi:putative toxin-antitoxin system toxin component, PIN family [Candidatus Microgenomates bacterium]|nr:putative toxin-antitoxin system toxin component, PIN family [Candidatus Microgenomates bacterium]
MRIVLDTNIYIAAALYSGLSKDILEFVFKTNSITLLVSEEILGELSNKLAGKFHWSEERINFYINDIKTMADLIMSTEKLAIITRDPKDNKIIECAVSGNANLVVTLDQDLIKLRNYKGIAIIHPKTFSWTFPEYFKKNG